MAERGMLFSAPLVKAILDGRKTETRRPVTKSSSRMVKATRQAWGRLDFGNAVKNFGRGNVVGLLVPQGTSTHGVASQTRAGDLIYVRETHAVVWNEADPCECDVAGSWCPEHMEIEYRADTGASAPAGWDNCNPEDRLLKWTPSIHMPRDRSRIDLRVTAVIAERVQDITEAGAQAEGVDATARGLSAYEQMLSDENGGSTGHTDEYRPTFARLWDSIYSTHLGLAWGENPWVWRIKFEVEKVRT